jgi:hypothetical protein
VFGAVREGVGALAGCEMSVSGPWGPAHVAVRKTTDAIPEPAHRRNGQPFAITQANTGTAEKDRLNVPQKGYSIGHCREYPVRRVIHRLDHLICVRKYRAWSSTPTSHRWGNAR